MFIQNSGENNDLKGSDNEHQYEYVMIDDDMKATNTHVQSKMKGLNTN